jgi:heme oxygenase (mycobilin-producing)
MRSLDSYKGNEIMTITRIGETQAKPELIEDLREFLLSILPLIKSSQGCQAVTLYQSHEDPATFMIVEEWDSIESHQASVRNIPPEKLAKIRPMLASSPSGGYFEVIGQE